MGTPPRESSSEVAHETLGFIPQKAVVIVAQGLFGRAATSNCILLLLSL
jgi:hypothetical protein